jgi:hypothetical protein
MDIERPVKLNLSFLEAAQDSEPWRNLAVTEFITQGKSLGKVDRGIQSAVKV